MWDLKYSIHYHVWDQPSFDRFLQFLPTYLPHWRMKMVDSVETIAGEFAYLLEKE